MLHQHLRARGNRNLCARAKHRDRVASAAATAVASALAIFAAANSSQAADVIKANNTDPLNAGTAWSGAITPGPLDVAVWNSTVTGANTSDLGGDLEWGGIRIANPGGAVTINGANTLTLDGLGIDMSAATQDLTINSNLSLGTNTFQSWRVASGRTLTIGSATYTRNPGATLDIDISAGGNVNFLTASVTGSSALTYATLNNGNDFAAIGPSFNVVSLNDVAPYEENLNSGGNLPSMSGTHTNVIDVVNSNTSSPTAVRLSNTMTMASGIRFNTAHATGLDWTVDQPSNRTLTIGGSGILVGPNVNTNVSFTGSGPTRAGNVEGFYVHNFSANTLTFFTRVTEQNAGTPLIKNGPGLVVLAGNGDAYTGGTVVQAGTLQFGAGGTTGDVPATGDLITTDSGVIAFDHSDSITVAANITGTGGVAINSPAGGMVTLAGTNTYTGPTYLNGGLLNLTGAANLGGSTQVNLNGGGIRYDTGVTTDITSGGLSASIGSNGGTINTNGNDVTLANALGGGGAGALNKTGAGALTLSATNAHTGAINVNAGTLRINGSAGNGGVNVNFGGTLGGSGTVNGLVTVNDGGHIAPGNSVGTLNVNALTLSSGSVLDYEFNGSANDKIVITASNGFTINGGGFNLFNENTTAAFATAGTYTLATFNGAIQGSGIGALSVLNGQPGFGYAFGTSGSDLTLTVTQTAFIAHWNVDGGGSWGTGTNWNPNTAPNGQGSIALMDKPLSAPSTVTLDGSKTVGGIVFDSANGYTIAAGSGGNLVIDNNGTIAQVSSVSGMHTISAPLSMNSDTLFVTSPSSGVTVSGDISGAGGLSKKGGGVLVLSGNNSYGGANTLNGGVVEVASNTALSSGAVSIQSNSTIRAGATNVTLSNPINLDTGVTATLDSQGNTLGLGGDINDTGGTGIVSKIGAGTLVLTGNANNGGGINVAAGTLQIGNGGGNGSIGNSNVNISSGAVLSYNRSDDQTLSNVIGGAGSVVKQGGGILTLAGNNTFTGGVDVQAGTLKAGLANTSFGNNGTINLASAATLDLDGWPTNTGPVTGTGTVTSGFAGVVTLTMNVPTDASFGGTFIDGGGQVSINKTGAGVYSLTGVSTLTTDVASNGGTLALTSPTSEVHANTISLNNGGSIRVDDGTLTASGVTSILNNGDGCRLTVNGGNVILSDFRISRSGGTGTYDASSGLQMNGGNLTVNSLNINYTNSWSEVVQTGGTFNIVGGVNAFLIGNGNNAGRGGFFSISGGTLNYAGSDGMILSNTDVQGIGLFQGGVSTMEGIAVFFAPARTTGFATLGISGGEVYLGANGIISSDPSGGTIILTGGTLGAKADWSSSLNMALDGAPGIALKAADATGAPFNITLSGNLNDGATPGGLVKTGAGTVTLSGNNTYTGATTVQQGMLILTNNAKNPVLSGAGGADVQGGRLVLDYNDTGTSVGPQVLSILDAGFDQTPRFSTSQIHTTNPDSTDKGLGWIDDATAKQVTVAYTYYGDANLDGQVDVTDLGALATNWQSSNVWAGGDFNYDGFVDVTDLGALATNWQKGVGNPLGPGSLEAALQSVGLGNVSVPEPASIGLIGLGLMGAFGTRRRRH